MSDQVGLDERLRLRRWLAAVGLTTAAEDASRIDTAETNAMALLGAHAACEALLGLLAGVRRYKAGDELSFGRLVEAASAKVALEPGLADDLDAMHRIRNAFVHASNTVAADETARAISNARRLMDLVTTTLGASWNLPPGGGLGTAVADVIDVEAVGMWLRHADLMHSQGRLKLAVDGLARALDGAVDRAQPALRSDRDMSVVRFTHLTGHGQDRVAEATQAQIDRLHRWVLPLALGVSPIAYQSLRDVIGRAQNTDVGGAPVPVFRPDSAAIREDDVRRAISQTAGIIFRLWAMGSLRSWRNDDKIVELAQPFIANPSGWAAGELSSTNEDVPQM